MNGSDMVYLIPTVLSCFVSMAGCFFVLRGVVMSVFVVLFLRLFVLVSALSTGKVLALFVVGLDVSGEMIVACRCFSLFLSNPVVFLAFAYLTAGVSPDDKLRREPPTRLWEPGVVHDFIMQCVLPKPRLDGPGTDDLEQSLLGTYLQERIRRNVYTAKDAASNRGKRSFVAGTSWASTATGSPCAASRSVPSSPAATGFPFASVGGEGRGKGVASPGAKSMRLDKNGLSPRTKDGDDSVRDSRKPADVDDDDEDAELSRLTTVISEGPGARWRSDWSDEDRAAFRKGIYEYRRNFSRIREHYLPHRTYGEIVSFFYRFVVEIFVEGVPVSGARGGGKAIVENRALLLPLVDARDLNSSKSKDPPQSGTGFVCTRKCHRRRVVVAVLHASWS